MLGFHKKTSVIKVKGYDITVTKDEFLSLTDIVRAKDGDFFISDWLRNRNTVEFLGVWETIHNPDFNYGEYAIIRSQAGLNSYKLSVKEWIEKTNAIGIKSTPGRYGGTFAHQDISFEFGMWISPEFKLYLIKEFQRLKEEETKRLESGVTTKRILASVNYRMQTDAIKEYLKPDGMLGRYVYANEADMLNMIVFKATKKGWERTNPDKEGNPRDHATVEQLVVLANMESLNAMLISKGLPMKEREVILYDESRRQMQKLLENPSIKRLSSGE